MSVKRPKTPEQIINEARHKEKLDALHKRKAKFAAAEQGDFSLMTLQEQAAYLERKESDRKFWEQAKRIRALNAQPFYCELQTVKRRIEKIEFLCHHSEPPELSHLINIIEFSIRSLQNAKDDLSHELTLNQTLSI